MKTDRHVYPCMVCREGVEVSTPLMIYGPAGDGDWIFVCQQCHRKLAQEMGAAIDRIRHNAPSTEERGGSCPCEWTTPCGPHCTCAKPYMSGGCSRCCKYGSDGQRLAAAEIIVKDEQYLKAIRGFIDRFPSYIG